jgi:hypothetical protein
MLQVAKNLFLHLGKYLDVVSMVDKNSLHAACVSEACGKPLSPALSHLPAPCTSRSSNIGPASRACSQIVHTPHRRVPGDKPAIFKQGSHLTDSSDRYLLHKYSSYRYLMINSKPQTGWNKSSKEDQQTTGSQLDDPCSSIQHDSLTCPSQQVQTKDETESVASTSSKCCTKKRYFSDLSSTVCQTSHAHIPTELSVKQSDSTDVLVSKQRPVDSLSPCNSDILNQAFLIPQSDSESTECVKTWHGQEEHVVGESSSSPHHLNSGKSSSSVEADHFYELTSVVAVLPTQLPTVPYFYAGMCRELLQSS